MAMIMVVTAECDHLEIKCTEPHHCSTTATTTPCSEKLAVTNIELVNSTIKG